MITELDADLVNPVTKETPMHCAARAGSLACLTELVAKGAGIAAQDLAGNTALHLAATNLPLLQRIFSFAQMAAEQEKKEGKRMKRALRTCLAARNKAG